MKSVSFAGWAPIRVDRDAGGAWTVDWCRLGERRFDEPFFDETIGAALRRRPFNHAFRRSTPLDELAHMFANGAALRPAGLVFHMSRCGSTLVAQMLASLRDSVVLSEAGPIDEVLGARRHEADVTDAWREERLRWIVSALGRSVPGDPRRFVVKMDAWHALDLPLIDRAFPGVPWIFVYRDPLEVMVSHRRRLSWMMSAVNSRRLSDLEPQVAMALPREEYHARVLERILAAALHHDVPSRRLVNYVDLPAAAHDDIPRWFGIEIDAAERASLARAGLRDAKQPRLQFVQDRDDKQEAADGAIRAVSQARLAPLYAALEAQREVRASR